MKQAKRPTRREVERAVRRHPKFLYHSVPQPGDHRIVFVDQTFLSWKEAYRYATSN